MKTTNEPQPEKAFAFSVFVKTRPVLIEVGKLCGEDFEYTEWPFGFFASHYADRLARLPEPESNLWETKRRTNALLQKMSDIELGKEEKLGIQAEILKIKEEGARPYKEHQDKIERLTAALPCEIEAFEEWSKNDPAGIAAVAQDKAFHEWEKAEGIRKAVEEREARRRQKIGRDLEELESQIGLRLTTLDIGHPDIDAKTARDFLEWHNQDDGDDFVQTNAILTGPSGTAKTRALAQAALWYAREHRGMDSVAWITGYDFAELVGDLATDKRQESKDRLAEITFAEILYFDDLGSANFITARTSRLFRLIDERYKHSLPTIISTNYTTAQLKKIFATTGETRDDATRILRRIIGTPAAPLAKFFHFKRPTTENAS